MYQLFKSTGIITGIMILFVAAFTGIWTLVSYLHHEDPQLIYDFALSAKNLHETLENTPDLIPNIESLINSVPRESTESDSRIDVMILHGNSAAHIYREDFSTLPAPNSTLQLYRLLIKESTLFARCYADLSFARSAYQNGDSSTGAQYRNEAINSFQEFTNLRQQNNTDLDSLLLKAELSLKKGKS